MSRLIDNQIWNARSFTNLSVEGKLLYLYLETSPETNYYGVFLLPNNQVISARTGVDINKIQTALDYLEKHNKIKLIGDYIIIFDYFKKQKGKLTSKHLKGLETFKQTLPQAVLTEFDKHLGNGYSMGIDTPMNGYSKGMDKSKVKESKVKENKEKESKVNFQPKILNKKITEILEKKIEDLNLSNLKKNSLIYYINVLEENLNLEFTSKQLIFEEVLGLDGVFDYLRFLISEKLNTETFKSNKNKIKYWTEVWYNDFLNQS